MMKAKTAQLGDVQLAIMRALWERGNATVAEVHDALQGERGLAPTTVATMLKKMEKKGIVAHRTEGRRFVYRATVSEEAVINAMVKELAVRHFDGQVSSLVSHLITGSDIDPDDLAAIRQMIGEAERKERARNV